MPTSKEEERRLLAGAMARYQGPVTHVEARPAVGVLSIERGLPQFIDGQSPRSDSRMAKARLRGVEHALRARGKAGEKMRVPR